MTDQNKKIIVERLTPAHLIGADLFHSGEQALDDYLKKFALENSERGISRAWIAFQEKNAEQLIGYYTLSSAQVEPETLPKKQKRGLPNYSVPAIRIGRLAVASKFQGKGYGASLLINALRRIVNVSEEIGIRLVIVDAKHDKAKNFYAKYGFNELQNNPLKLMIPLKTIEQISSNLFIQETQLKKSMPVSETFEESRMVSESSFV